MSKLAKLLWRLRKRTHQLLHPWEGEHQSIIVPGVQRSGTNMLMNVFDQSLETDVFHESDPRAFDCYHLRPLIRQQQLREKSRARVFVVKALLDSEKTKAILTALRPAKAIWMFRHYDDVVNSNLRHWPGGRNQIDELVHDRYTVGYRAWGMTDESLDLVRQNYHPRMSDASAIALFWYYRNQLFFDQRLDQDSRVICIKYEDVAAKPLETLSWLFSLLEIEFTPRIGTHIHAKSIGKRSPSDISSNIRELCEKMLVRFEEIYTRHRQKD